MHQDDALRVGDEDRAQRLDGRAKLGHRVAENLHDHDPLTSYDVGFLKEALVNYILHTEEDCRFAGLENVDMSTTGMVRGLADPGKVETDPYSSPTPPPLLFLPESQWVEKSRFYAARVGRSTQYLTV